MTWDNIINIFVQPWVGAERPYLEPFWPAQGLDFDWGADRRAGFYLYSSGPIGDCDHGVYLDHQFWDGVVPLSDRSLVRRPFYSNERSKANGVINLMGGVGGLLAYFVGGLLFNSLGRSAPFIAGSLAMVAALVVALIFVKEPREIEQEEPKKKSSVIQDFLTVVRNPEKSGMFVLAWHPVLVYGIQCPGNRAFLLCGFQPGHCAGIGFHLCSAVTISFLAFSVPAGLIAQRIGRRRTIQIGLTGMTFYFWAGYFMIQDVISFMAYW